MRPVIKVTNLTKHFNEIIAVDNLSFTVNQGDIYGFLGQNGAGKSTTIRMLLSLIEPSNGEIEMFGMNLFTNIGRIVAHHECHCCGHYFKYARYTCFQCNKTLSLYNSHDRLERFFRCKSKP